MKEKTISDIINSHLEPEDGRWNWYGENNNNNTMIQFDEKIHDYENDNLKAEVHIKKDLANRSTFGIRMFNNNVWVKDELFDGYSEMYAENAAENYVFGIKE